MRDDHNCLVLTATEDQWELWALYSVVPAEMWIFFRSLTLFPACRRFSSLGLRWPANRSRLKFSQRLLCPSMHSAADRTRIQSFRLQSFLCPPDFL